MRARQHGGRLAVPHVGGDAVQGPVAQGQVAVAQGEDEGEAGGCVGVGGFGVGWWCEWKGAGGSCSLAGRARGPSRWREREKKRRTKKGKNKRNCSCWRGPGRPGQRRAACSTPAGTPGTGRPRRRRRWTGRCRRRCRPSAREGEERRGARRGEWCAQGSACAAPVSLPLLPPLTATHPGHHGRVLQQAAHQGGDARHLGL